MTEAKVAITDDLILDFTGLFSESPPEAPESHVEPLLGAEWTGDREAAQKPAERLTEGLEGQQAKKLYLDTQREREDRQRSLEVYRTYQENIKTSSQLQTEILKGIKAGEDVYSLFLKAAKAISLMTSNKLFYTQIEADTRAIYGNRAAGRHDSQSRHKEKRRAVIAPRSFYSLSLSIVSLMARFTKALTASPCLLAWALITAFCPFSTRNSIRS